MLACLGAVTRGASVWTDSIETAQMPIDAGVGTKAPILHRSRICLPLGAPDDELHRLLRGGLAKRVQASPAPFD